MADWLRLALQPPCGFTHAMNEGKRHGAQRGWLVRSGVKAGYPDLTIWWPSGVGFAEIKTRKGSLSKAQRQLHSEIEACGLPLAVVRSLPELQAVLSDWCVPHRDIRAE